MRDIILHDMAYKKGGQINTDNRVHQIQPVITRSPELACQQCHNLVDHTMQDEGSYSSKQPYEKGKHQQEHTVADMLYPPLVQLLLPGLFSYVFRLTTHYFLIIFTSPFSFNRMILEG